MRFFVPLEMNNGIDSLVSPHFGRAPYYAIVDVDDENVKYAIRASPQLMHEAVGCDAATLIEVSGAEAVVVKGIGRKALMALESMGVKVYHTNANTLREVIEEIKLGTLRPYTAFNVCGHRCFEPHYPGYPPYFF